MAITIVRAGVATVMELHTIETVVLQPERPPSYVPHYPLPQASYCAHVVEPRRFIPAGEYVPEKWTARDENKLIPSRGF